MRDEYRAYRAINNSIDAALRGNPDPKLGELLVGFPRAYYFGQEQLFNYLILDYLGNSLEELFEKCSRRFSLKTVCYLAVQMVLISHAASM